MGDSLGIDGAIGSFASSIDGVIGSIGSAIDNVLNTQSYLDVATLNPQGNQSPYASTHGQSSVSIAPLGGTDGPPASSRAGGTTGSGTSGSDMSPAGANAQMGGNHPSGLQITGRRAEPTDGSGTEC